MSTLKEQHRRPDTKRKLKSKSEAKELKDELLVYGYLKKIQPMNEIVPLSIYKICNKYYHFQISYPSSTLQIISKEVKDLLSDPSPFYSAGPLNDNHMFIWKGTISGPLDSPYEGGIFKVYIVFPKDYPFKPPRCKFITKIYHCNINEQGDIALNILQDEWSPAFTISTILLSIFSFLTDPNADDPFIPSIAKLYKLNRKKHDQICRQWTIKYAQ
eukprot:339914_1